LYQADDSDPLFRFSISQSGELMLLESDATVASWGTDYWGYWSDPFPYANNEVNYIIGLTNTTYQYQPLPGDKIDVTKILIVQPYPSGDCTTLSQRYPDNDFIASGSIWSGQLINESCFSQESDIFEVGRHSRLKGYNFYIIPINIDFVPFFKLRSVDQFRFTYCRRQ
jgi:hypothetical protein